MKKDTEAADPIGSAVGASRRPRMSPYEVTWLIACCARIPSVLMAAVGRLETTLFEPAEARFILLWRAIAAAAADNRGAMPADPAAAKEIVALKCAGEVAADPGRMYYTPTVEQAVMGAGGLLDEMFLLPVGPDVEAQGMTLLARFVTERNISDPLRRALAGVGAADTLADPAAVLSALEQHTRDVAGIGTDPGTDAVLDVADYRPPSPKKFTTKLAWLDEMMGGGQAPQECYVLLGPTGGGKSALAVQLAVEGAELQSALAAELGPDVAGHWYYFTYEMNEKAQLRPRVYQYGARVHQQTYADDQPYSTADDPATMKAYEADPYVNSPGNPVMGERERAALFHKRMSGFNSRLHIVDYSGDYPGHGLGGVEEVAGYLRREQARGRRVTGVLIDYAGISVTRTIAAKKMRPESEYPMLAAYVDNVRSQVCVPLRCCAWVLHQLHGDEAKKAPGAKIHHSGARGCRNFADNSDFGFQLTPYNKTTGLLVVHCTKHRRAKGLEDGTIVRFRGEFGAFISPDQEYEIDPTTRQIVPRGFADMLSRPGAGGRPRPPVDPRAGLA